MTLCMVLNFGCHISWYATSIVICWFYSLHDSKVMKLIELTRLFYLPYPLKNYINATEILPISSNSQPSKKKKNKLIFITVFIRAVVMTDITVYRIRIFLIS